MKLSKRRMKAKGWTDEEIEQANTIFAQAKKTQHPHHKRINEAIYWAVLLLGVFTMVGVAVWVMPVFVFGRAGLLYPLLIFIGLGFGILFNHLIKDLDHLTLRHHMLISAIMPIVGIASFLLVVGQTNDFVALGGNKHNALLVGVIFTTFFIIPYIHNVSKK